MQCQGIAANRARKPPHLVRPLLPQSEGIKQLVVDRLYDLTNAGDPPPQALGPASLLGAALGRMDDFGSVAFQPTPMILFSLEAFVCDVGSPKTEPAPLSLGLGLALSAKKLSANG
jgi:hypothetical protein